MELLEELWEIGCSLVPFNLLSRLTIKGLWDIDTYFQPNHRERLFVSHCLIAQTHFQGCCFYQKRYFQKEELLMLIGQNFRVAKRSALPIKIAILDSIFKFGRKHMYPSRELRYENTPSKKAYWRAKIVCEEVQRLLTNERPPKPFSISILGVSGIIIHYLLQLGYPMLACDLDPHLAGSKIHGVKVLNGSYQEYCIQNAEIAVVTGMALTTGTMKNILELASKYKTKIVIYAETGANIAPWYLQYGARVAICEHMPFYNFEGASKISVYRKQ